MRAEMPQSAPKPEKRRRKPITPEEGSSASGEIIPEAVSAPIPSEALRPKRAKKPQDFDVIAPFVPSADAREAAGLYHRREQAAKKTAAEAPAEESPYEEMTLETRTPSQEAATRREDLRAETIELNDRFEDAKAEYEALADAVDRRAKEIANELSARNFPAETILIWTEAIQQREGLSQKLDAAIDKMTETRKAYIDRYEAWEKTQNKDESASAEMEKVIDDLVAEHQPASASFSREEEAWFKKGEDEEREMDQVRAEIQAAGGQPESLIETPHEIDANVRQAEQMVMSGELNGQLFNVNDYRYLLTRKAQIDRELEEAGWWAARKLRSELKETQKSLADYEQQIQSVHNERAAGRDKTRTAAMTPEQRKAQDKKSSLWSRITGR